MILAFKTLPPYFLPINMKNFRKKSPLSNQNIYFLHQHFFWKKDSFFPDHLGCVQSQALDALYFPLRPGNRLYNPLPLILEFPENLKMPRVYALKVNHQ